MSSNELDHEPDHVQYVDEREMRVLVGPSRSDNFRKQKAKRKLCRRKASEVVNKPKETTRTSNEN